MEVNEQNGAPSYAEVLSNRNFVFLWISQIFCQLADRMLVGLLLLMVHKLTQSNLGLSIPMISFGLSSILFAALAGVYVDHWDKKYVLVISNLLRSILILAFFFFPFISNSLMLIFVLSFLIFTISQFFIPAETTVIPIVVKKKNLIVANSLFMSSWMGVTVLAFGLISVLNTFQVDLRFMFVVASIFYFIACIVDMLIYISPLEPGHQKIEDVYLALMQGLEYVRRQFILKFSLYKLFLAATVIAILSALAIDFVKNTIHMQAGDFGYFVSFAGLGMFLGVGLLGKFGRMRRSKLISFGFLLTGFMLIFLAHIAGIYMAFAVIFCLGIGNAFITAPIQTIMQENVAKLIRGRVFGIQNMIINLGFTFPTMIAGFAADKYSSSSVFLWLGIIVLCSGLITQFIPKFKEI